MKGRSYMQAIIRYELVINEALRSALMLDTPDEQINEFIRFFGKHIGCDRIYIFEDNKKEHVTNVIKLRNGIFEGNTKNVLLFFFVENLNFFVDIQIEMCGLLSLLIIGQLFIGICFWRYL